MRRTVVLLAPVVVTLACFWLPLTTAEWRGHVPYGDQDDPVRHLWLFLIYAAPLACVATFVVLLAWRTTRPYSGYWLLGAVIGFAAEVTSFAYITDGFSS